jgi:ferrochelatase
LGDAVMVDWAMRYGTPAIPERIQSLMDAGCERILLAPLYPQYSAATTATVVDKAADKLRTMRWQPSLRTLPPYHDDPAYIDALAQDLSRQLDALDFAPEVLLLSFHGMPQRTLELGDPYHCHCQKTSRLLQERLVRPGLRFRTTFQSRFGPAKWLGPATDDTFAEEAQAGTKRLAVAAPGFSADCLETLEELAIQGREQFTEAGGAQFAALSCLNTSAAGLDMLETLLRRELSGWIPA